MARRLDRTVYVKHDNRVTRFRAGEDIPDWAAALMTPRRAWETEPEPAADPVGEPGPVEHPPLAGPGSSRRAWEDHAASLGVTVTDDMTRKDIIAAVESAGYPLT